MTAKLITDYSQLFKSPPLQVLDLACGSGRNGLWFANRGDNVTFIDKSLPSSELTCSSHQYLQWDLEDGSAPVLPIGQYDVVLIFNYLHRPLFNQIKAAVKPGGLILYETFTAKQAEVGRPSNPDFLLKNGELKSEFQRWNELHYFEGGQHLERIHNSGNTVNYKAQLIARKPIS